MTALSKDLALRIGLAARVLPGVEIPRLLEILQERLGAPLSDEKLKSFTVTQLKTGIGSLDGEEDGEDIGIGLANIKQAVRYLWGEDGDVESLPAIKPYTDGDMPNSVRVAVASNSGSMIDGHFGSCIRFLIYQLNVEEYRPIDIRSTVEADSADDKNLFRAQLIEDCHILLVQSIGGPAAAKVIRANIYPLKVPEPMEAGKQLLALQQVMHNNPPPWLAKILGQAAEERVRFKSDVEAAETAE
ncbi:MAG: dinitrogenase iron-molybdenum cofactor biosynthesis protein [Gammaproteobacteria bacterium]